MAENKYQAGLIKRLPDLIPGCEVVKNDANLRQGIPDLTVFAATGKFGLLEVKDSEDSAYQPNQEYYLEHFDQMGFARMICPENEEEVLRALQKALAA